MKALTKLLPRHTVDNFLFDNLGTEKHADMTLFQPSLDEKLAHFDLMKKLSEDSEDSGDEDGLAVREQLDRQRRMRFFLNGERTTFDAQDALANASTVLADDDMANDERHNQPVRGGDAKTTIPIIKATQQFRIRTRVHEMLDQTVDETVIPDTRRVEKTQHRQVTTPLPFSKHLRKTMSMDSPSLAAKKGKKRKRESIDLRPESEQIFKGLQFYYIPNDDIAPARRLRICKAREFGALWVREPSTATHVIVDKGIAYGDVKKVLGGGGETRAVVNEEYPIDCIRFRCLLDHRQKKYRVPGQPLEEETDGENEVIVAVAEQLTRLNELPDSLKLKPEHRSSKKWAYITDPDTPLGSNDGSRDAGLVGKAADVTPSVESQSISLEVEEKTLHLADVAGKSREHGNDELSQCITMLQEFKDLPLDNDEDDESPSVTNQSQQHSDEEELSGSDLEEQISKTVKDHARTRNKATRFEDQFACNQGGLQNADANNPNFRTIEVLQRMADYYDRVNDHWRTTGYRKAISTLKRHGVKITSEEEAFKLPHIGQRIAQKIEEIATTNELRRLKYAEQEPADSALQLFLQIYGVGTKQAQQWLAKGYRTLDDLRTKAKLTPSQRIGIDHLGDLNSRIPRQEVEALGAYVKRAAAKVDPSVELIIGGSYRRGSSSSRDVDFIVTKPDTKCVDQLRAPFTELIRMLTDDGFLTACLASFRCRSNGSKFHGCCVLPQTEGIDDENYRPVWRRIDFLLVPETELGAALIYFTGNDIFNRSMRLLASKKGMRLNQRGLYRNCLRGRAREKVTTGELVEGRCERRIFELLGVQWREPSERWC